MAMTYDSPLHDDNPTSIKPRVTIAVIMVCVLVVDLLLYPRVRAYVLVPPGFEIEWQATNFSVAIRRESGVAAMRISAALLRGSR